jgi:CHAT domain-containing protein
MREHLIWRVSTWLALASAGMLAVHAGSDQTPQMRPDDYLLADGQVVERSISRKQLDTYRIPLGEGQYLRIVLEHGPAPLFIALRNPAGELIAEYRSGEYARTYVSYVSTKEGVFNVSVSSAAVECEEGYRLAIKDLRRAAPEDRERVEGERTFEAGQKLRYERKAELLDRAMSLLKAATSHWKTSGDRPEEAAALNTIGEVYEEIGDLAKAYDYFSQAVDISRGAGDLSQQLVALIGLARNYAARGDRDRSIQKSSEALGLCRSTGDRYHEAQALNSTGMAYVFTSKPQAGVNYFQEALSIFSALRDKRAKAATLSNLGSAHFASGDLQLALDYEENQALPLWRSTGDLRGEAQTAVDIGMIYGVLGEGQKGLDSLERARSIFRTIGDRSGEASCLNAIAGILVPMGDLDGALDHYQRAREVFCDLSDGLGEDATIAVIGKVYELKGDDRTALVNYLDMLARATKAGHSRMQEYGNSWIGNIYARTDPEKAMSYYRRALSIAEADGDRRGEAESLNGIGYAYGLLGKNGEALAYYSKALSIRNDTMDRGGQSLVLYNIAQAERRLGNLAGALAAIEKVITIAEDLRTNIISQDLRASYLAIVHHRYEVNTEVLVRLAEREHSKNLEIAAFESAERAHARCLLEMLTEAHTDIREGIDPFLLSNERSLLVKLDLKAQARMRLLSAAHTQEQASEIEKDWDSIYAEYKDLQNKIKSQSPRYAALTQPRPIGAKDVQERTLDENTMLLEYSLGEERSFLWAVTEGGLSTYILPPRKTIEDLATQVYKSLSETAASEGGHTSLGDKSYWLLATKLSQMLLAPVASQLRNKRLLVVPDGALQYIPLAALPIPSTSGSLAARKPGHMPMVAEHEIISLPSASTLAVMRQEFKDRKPAPKAIAVFANPVFSKDDPRISMAKAGGLTNGTNLIAGLRQVMRGGNAPGEELRLPALFSSQDEAEAIKNIVPEGDRLIETGLEASRENVKKPEIGQYRVIHFATHGLFDADNPERSGIVLSMVDGQGNLRDGVLRLHDIYNLNLPAELVVLSACNTAIGKDIKGEGLIGLTRGFMYAGAARVISSLWKVDDEASAELMRRFYQKMLKAGERPAAALRSAQVEMLNTRRWNSPRHWAGFIIQGEWE